MKKLLLTASAVAMLTCGVVFANDPNDPPNCGVMDLPGVICPTPTPQPLAANTTTITKETDTTDGEIIGWLVMNYYLGRF